MGQILIHFTVLFLGSGPWAPCTLDKLGKRAAPDNGEHTITNEPRENSSQKVV